MSGADFLDTNVLVYVFDRRDARRRGIAEGLLNHALERGSAVISFQVVQESLNVVTRKIRPALAAEEAEAALRGILAPLWQVMPSTALYARGLGLQARLSLSFYDSLIVAAALEAGCKRLLSEDLQHGQRIEGLRIENPFRA
jgi:predicted nucleic acid-binding protein